MGSPDELGHPALREVEHRLDSGDLAGAQRGLAELGAPALEFGDAVAYLATRMLYQRGRLSNPDVAERMKDLLLRAAQFLPRAKALFDAADGGALDKHWTYSEWATAHGVPKPLSPPSSAPAEVGERDLFDGHGITSKPPPPPKSLSPPSSPSVGMTAKASALPSDSGGETERSSAPVSVDVRFSSEPEQPPSSGHETTRTISSDPLDAPDAGLERRPSRELRHPEIPRAGKVPAFSDRPKDPSYVPPERLSDPGPTSDPLRSRTTPRSRPPRSGEDGWTPAESPIPLRTSRGGASSPRPREPSAAPNNVRSAGRYSETPLSPEVVSVRASSRPPAPARALPSTLPPEGDEPTPHRTMSADPDWTDARREVSRGEPPIAREEDIDSEDGARSSGSPRPRQTIRSGPPPAAVAQPSLFDVAALVDAGDFETALAMLDEIGHDTPDHALLRAKALDGRGLRPDAIDVLARLARAPLLDPEIRAGSARQLLEMGEVPTALEQAEQAFEDDARPPLVRLTYAWAAIRSARRFEKRTGLIREADEILRGLDMTTGPLANVASALQAGVASELDDPKSAIALGQRCLLADPSSVDALAAVALAAAKLGRLSDSENAWLELSSVSREEADALRDRLARLGVPVGATDPRPAGRLESSTWDAIELAVDRGDVEVALRDLETVFTAHLAKAGVSAARTPADLGPLTAGLLTRTPIWRHFAPYDYSLWSLGRIDAAMLVLYGERPADAGAAPTVALVTGVYTGETLRRANGGRWEARDGHHHVVTSKSTYSPIEAVLRRGTVGASASFLRAVGASVQRPGERAWAHAVSNPEAPPTPWSGKYPAAGAMSALGRDVKRSPIGVYCRRLDERGLDRTLESLSLLDRYLDVIAHPAAPADREPAWAPRAATLVGAYVGETLRARLGGEWSDDERAEGPDRLRILFPGGGIARPVSHLLDRFEEREPSTLAEYVDRVANRVTGGADSG